MLIMRCCNRLVHEELFWFGMQLLDMYHMYLVWHGLRDLLVKKGSLLLIGYSLRTSYFCDR